MRRSSSLAFAEYCGHASFLAEKYPETSAAALEGTNTHAEIAAGIIEQAEATTDAGKSAVKWVRNIVDALRAMSRGLEPILSVESEVILLDDEGPRQ